MSETVATDTPNQASYSLRTLLFSTSLFAWIFAVNQWLGSPYGWLSAIPLSMGLPTFILRPWSIAGGVIGFVVFAIIGEFFIIGWHWSDKNYLPSLVTVGLYGVTCGSGMHAAIRGIPWVGLPTSLAAVIALIIVVNYSP